MKSKFLNQVTRLLTLNLLLAGLPQPYLWSGDSSTPDCSGGNFSTPSSCSLSYSPVKGSGLTSPINVVVSQTASQLTAGNPLATGGAISQYQDLSKNLVGQTGGPNGAANDYINVYSQYTGNLTVSSVIANLFLNYLMPDIDPCDNPLCGTPPLLPTNCTNGCPTSPAPAKAPVMVTLPFGTTSAGFGVSQSTPAYPGGDFRQANLTSQQKEQMILSYIGYLYNYNYINHGQGGAQNIARFLSYIIVYAALQNQYYAKSSGNTYLNVSTYDGLVSYFSNTDSLHNQISTAMSSDQLKTVISTLTTQGNSFGTLSFKAGFTASSLPATLLTTLSSVSYVEGSVPSSLDLPTPTGELYSLLSSTDWTQFESVFSSSSNSCFDVNGNSIACNSACGLEGNSDCSYIIQFEQTIQQLMGQNMYYNCSVDPASGQGTDAALYYANPAQVESNTIALADHALSSIQAAQKQANQAPMLALPDSVTAVINNLGNPNYGYVTGQFMVWLPDLMKTGAVAPQGKSDTGASSPWASACSNSSSNQAYKHLTTIFQNLQKLTAPATCSGTSTNGSPTCLSSSNGKTPTMQDAQYNLLNAVLAANSAYPIADTAKASPDFEAEIAWIPSSMSAVSATTASKVGGSVISYGGGGQTVDPNTLAINVNGALTDVNSVINLSSILDIGQILSIYANCWSDVVYCNQSPTDQQNSKSTLDQIKHNFGKSSLVQAFLSPGGIVMVLFALPALAGIVKWTFTKLGLMKKGMSIEDVMKAVTDSNASMKAQMDKLASAEVPKEKINPRTGESTSPSQARQQQVNQQAETASKTTGNDPLDPISGGEGYDPRIFNTGSTTYQQLESNVQRASENLEGLVADAKGGTASGLLDYAQDLADMKASLEASGGDLTDVDQKIQDLKEKMSSEGVDSDDIPDFPDF